MITMGFPAADALDSAIAQPPAFLDRLFLLSPRTCFGILECNSQNEFSSFDASTLIQSILGSLLPCVAFRLFLLFFDNTNTIHWPLLLPNPWTLQSTGTALRQVCYLARSLLGQYRLRSKAYVSAIDCLQARIQQQRAYRTRRYDVFLPPFPNNNPKKQQQAVLLIPGAMVPHVAYAQVASRLSDAGILVAVVSQEPLRLAHEHLGCDRISMQRIMKRVEQQQQQSSQPTTKVLEWNLMGHSMGAFAAMRLFRQFQEEHLSSNPISKLVVWGVGAFLSMSTDLSSFYSKNNNGMNTPRILKVQATNDVIVDLTKSSQNEFQTYFPSDTQVEWIEGGTHGGFASYYQSPSSSFQEEKGRGGDDCISYAEQQDQACALTARFLLEETT